VYTAKGTSRVEPKRMLAAEWLLRKLRNNPYIHKYYDLIAACRIAALFSKLIGNVVFLRHAGPVSFQVVFITDDHPEQP